MGRILDGSTRSVLSDRDELQHPSLPDSWRGGLALVDRLAIPTASLADGLELVMCKSNLEIDAFRISDQLVVVVQTVTVGRAGAARLAKGVVIAAQEGALTVIETLPVSKCSFG